MIGSKRSFLGGVVAVSTLIFAAFPASALDPALARAHVSAVAEKMLEIVESSWTIDRKRAAFREVLTRDTAIQDIARIAVGRTWKGLSDAKRAEYTAAFTDYLTETYSKRFGEFGGESIEIGAATDQGRKGVFVVSQVISPSGSAPVEVEWRVVDRNGGPKILDLYVEGASLLVTQKSEFETILERSGDNIDVLIQEISTN